MIQVEQLIHCYGTKTDAPKALDGINLTIRQGEFVAIVGSNGSGKSTLAKHLNALLLPTEGEVRIDGMSTKNPEHLWKVRQTIGMVFQNPDNQIVAAVVEEDVAFGPENIGLPSWQIKERVDEALQLVDMSEYRQHSPHLLSGGQKQRVAIAGVIAMRPSCIVLDEPTAMLDPLGRQEVMETIKRLNKEEGITIILITHFMDEAVQADRVVAMKNGKMMIDGTPRHVFSQVSAIKGLGLDVPDVTALARALRSKGIQVPQDVMTVEEMVVALCR
jgi:energy-coupling factor transport system ATP-binding protein